jgi:murein DD-endopeptidase MepM/ murein hydrolase activator NlpD
MVSPADASGSDDLLFALLGEPAPERATPEERPAEQAAEPAVERSAEPAVEHVAELQVEHAAEPPVEPVVERSAKPPVERSALRRRDARAAAGAAERFQPVPGAFVLDLWRLAPGRADDLTIIAPSGERIHSITAGSVITSGQAVEIRGPDGVTVRYEPVEPGVAVDARVAAGQVLGRIGRSADQSALQLRATDRAGVPINPFDLMVHARDPLEYAPGAADAGQDPEELDFTGPPAARSWIGDRAPSGEPGPDAYALLLSGE